MNYTDAKEACESFGGRLADPSSFTTEEKLDVMQCIPPDVVFWTNQKGSKDGLYWISLNRYFKLSVKCRFWQKYGILKNTIDIWIVVVVKINIEQFYLEKTFINRDAADVDNVRGENVQRCL